MVFQPLSRFRQTLAVLGTGDCGNGHEGDYGGSPLHFKRLLLGLVERNLHHLGLEQPVADLDVYLGVHLVVRCVDITHTDGDIQRGRHGSGCHVADGVALSVADLIAVTGNTAVDKLEAHQLALEALVP